MNNSKLKNILRGELEVPDEVSRRISDTLASLGAKQTQTTARRKPFLLRPVKRIILIAAVVTILTATALALTPQFRDSVWGMGSFSENKQENVVLSGFGLLPMKDELREFILEIGGWEDIPHAGDTIVGQEVIMPSFELVLPSYKESADFFGVELAYSPLMAEQYLVSGLSAHEEINEAGFWGILSREPGVMSIIWPSELFGYKGAIVQISTNSYFGDEEAIVSITASFRVIDSAMYSESTYHKVQAFNEVTWPVNSDYHIYTSPHNGIAAMIRDGSPLKELTYKTASFTINDVMYTIIVMTHDEMRALEIVHEVIDTLEWMS